jgi:enoyl-CoA hydratase
MQVNRPQVRNALDWQAMRAFASSVEEAQQALDLRVLIVTGTPEIFIAGGDLKALHHNTSQEDGMRLSSEMSRALARLESLPCPTIAALDGPARGGGAEIALACDLRVMSEAADLGFVQVTLGLTPGWGAGQRLLRLVGYSRALEWLATGRILAAEEALGYGLANRVVERGQALHAALGLARDIAAQPLPAVQAVKRLLRLGLALPPEAAAAAEQAIFPPLWAAEEHLQAVDKFVNRK